jgi:heme exporter protein D
MIWASMHDFWRMGGYGLYVWGSFGVTALLLVLEIGLTRQRRHALLAQLRQHPTGDDTEDWQS